MSLITSAFICLHLLDGRRISGGGAAAVGGEMAGGGGVLRGGLGGPPVAAAMTPHIPNGLLHAALT